MNSEKVKEILKFCSEGRDCYDGCPYKHDTHCVMKISKQALNLINDLESENKELNNELKKEQINNLNCDTELQYKEKRIAELEKENKSLYDSYHKGYKVGYEYGKQDAVSSDRAESDNQTSETTQSDYRLKQFAEMLKEISCEMYLKEQLHRCIDEILKEFINK